MPVKTNLLLTILLFLSSACFQHTFATTWNCGCNSSELPADRDVKEISTVIIECDDDEVGIPDIKALTALDTIIVKGSNVTDIQDIIKAVAQNENITTLIFKGNSFSDIPKQVKKLSNITSLRIENNPNFNLNGAIERLSNMTKLKNLELPNNNINQVPKSISELKDLKHLDLSNNQITDLPKGFDDLKRLEYINLQGNPWDNSFDACKEIASMSLKKLIIDGYELDGDERSFLKNRFRRAEIIYIEADEEEAEDEEEVEDIDDGDNAEVEVDDAEIDLDDLADSANAEPAPAPKKKIGSFTVQKNILKAYSPAYTFFPNFYRSMERSLYFDSTSFEQRYISKDYYNVHPLSFYTGPPNSAQTIRRRINISERSTNYIHLKRRFKPFRKELVFRLYDNKGSKYTTMQFNPELRAFNFFSWVFTGDLSNKEFKKTFLKNRFQDIRIYYAKGGATFKIEVKTDSSHISFDAYPRYDKLKTDITKAQSNYFTIYERYKKYLQTRSKRFERKLISNKNKHNRESVKARKQIWSRFQSLYMSKEEKRLSYDEWIAYYQKIISNEKLAFFNADATALNFRQGLTIEGFTRGLFQRTGMSAGVQTIDFHFMNDKDEKVAVTSFVIVSKSNNSYVDIQGSIGPQPTSVLINTNEEYDIVAFLLNGDVGVLSGYSCNTTDTGSEIKLNIIPRKLASVGQIYRNIGL